MEKNHVLNQSINQLLTHLPSLFDASGTEAFASRKQFTMKCNGCWNHFILYVYKTANIFSNNDMYSVIQKHTKLFFVIIFHERRQILIKFGVLLSWINLPQSNDASPLKNFEDFTKGVSFKKFLSWSIVISHSSDSNSTTASATTALGTKGFSDSFGFFLLAAVRVS